MRFLHTALQLAGRPVEGVTTTDGVDLTGAINQMAQQYDLPPQVLLAIALAESDLTARAARERAWPDVSYGPWQQTVAYAPIGNQTNTPANRAAVRETLTADMEQAARIAAQQLAPTYHQYGGDWREAAARYNGGPAMSWDRLVREHPGHAQNYLRGWAQSAAYLAPPISDPGALPGAPLDLPPSDPNTPFLDLLTGPLRQQFGAR